MSRLSKARPDKLLRIAAHHDEFTYMLWKMEYGAGNKPNNRFSILNGDKDDYIDILSDFDMDFEATQRTNGQYEQTFGISRFRW